jgi:hypothetical protein
VQRQSMQVFVSWSGPHAADLAHALRRWLPSVLWNTKIFVSSRDIGIAQPWLVTLSDALRSSQFGIICVTPASITSPWVLFEAGMLAGVLGNQNVAPYLLGVTQSQLPPPLSQFQSAAADRKGTRGLVRAIARASSEQYDRRALDDIFDYVWPNFESRLTLLGGIKPAQPTGRAKRKNIEARRRTTRRRTATRGSP